MNRISAANKGFAIAGGSCFADTFVQGGSSVLRTKFSAKTSPPSQPPETLACILKKTKQSFFVFLRKDYL